MAGRLAFLPIGALAMLLAALAASGPGATGTTWFVDPNCAAPGTGTPGDPFCEIQSAICAAMSGDMVSVAPGTYSESIRMKPGVSVSSTGGASITTINGSGQQCTENDYCTKRLTTTQCSTVLFASGHTPTTVLEGFTITGGEGFVDSIYNTLGGGVYVFSSPTIRDNIITNNILQGPPDDMRGGGIYIAVGQPIITQNTITLNKAVPPDASGSYGYGGGIFAAFFSAPIITENIISQNMAGDPNDTLALAGGGGIMAFPGTGPEPLIIDRNLITDNDTINRGGGIALRNRLGSAADAIVTNNILDGNRAWSSTSYGGGIFTYLNNSLIFNNTILENTAWKGGGIYQGESVMDNVPMVHTNNIIFGNRIVGFGAAGGVYVLDIDPNYAPTISYNDLFGNDLEQIAGGQNDPNTIGFDGNFSADPLLVDPNNGDYSLDPNSPAIDEGLDVGAPPVDFEGKARGIDGDGTIDSPEVGDVDVGALESYVFCQAIPELCDGIDNNCDAVVDEGFPDTDGDMLADCIDDDDDNDTVLDPNDCAPLDDTAFAPPAEVVLQNVTGLSPTITYDLQNIGTGTYYEVLSGFLTRIQATGGFQQGFCLDPNTDGGTYVDPRPPPPAGEGWYYLLLTANGCGRGTLGTVPRDEPGAGDVCPLGVVDGDFDGSASDLDCDDADPLRSHLLPEICDTIDNDCDSVPDDMGQISCGIGACETTTDFCIAGVEQTCTPGAPAPSDATCDGIDDDCNNQIDEDWVCPFSPFTGKGGGSFISCTTTCGVGECAGNEGTLNCTGGMEVDSCDPFEGAVAEVCDGLDNDCNAVVDDGFLDTDGDMMADCVDPDDDNDGVNDGMDCAPLDDTTWGVPVEVTDVEVQTGSPTPITFMEQMIGSATIYEAATGEITSSGTVAFMSGTCLMTTASSPAMDGGAAPALGTVRYYLVKSTNICGIGTYGSAPRDTLPACP